MRKKLTTKTVEAMVPNGPKRFEVYDLTLPGFGIRVSTNGHKSWFCAARVGNRPRRHTLGPYPRVSLADARDAARKVMNDARAGVQSDSVDEEARLFEHVISAQPVHGEQERVGVLGRFADCGGSRLAASLLR